MKEDAPIEEIMAYRPVSNLVLAIIPGTYAWQLCGWGIAGGVYFVVATALAAAAWYFVLRGGDHEL